MDDALHNDLLTTMKDNDSRIEEKYPTGTFRYLFWKEQMKCAMASNAHQMRWHPTIIKWCLNLKLLSSAAYHSLRTAGFIKLPSERTLRDYTHYFKSKPGFQVEVEQMLMKEAGLDKSTILGYQKFVTILFDEIKVKESIVYDKHSSHVLGFVELNDLYDELLQLEDSEEGHKPVATHVLAFMVRGIFTDLKFPFAHFPTKDISGDQLFSLIWEAIERIERLGLKVVTLTGDGCSLSYACHIEGALLQNQKYLCTRKKIHILLLRCSTSNENCTKLLVPFQQERNKAFMGMALLVMLTVV